MDTQVATLPKQRAVVVPNPLDAVDLIQFYSAETERASKAESTRMSRLIAKFKVSSQDSIKTAVKDYVEREEKRGEKEKLIARVHASEIKSLFGFAVTLGQSLDGMGYKTAIDTARAALKVAKIRWDGSRVKEKGERETEKAAKTVGAVAEREYLEVTAFRNRTGRDPSPEEITAIRDEITGKVVRATQVELASGLLKKHGAPWCEALVDCLIAAITAAEAEAREQVAAVATGTNG